MIAWTLIDTWTLTRRALAHWRRQPEQLVIGLSFMVMLVLLFGYLFGGAMEVPGGGNYREFLMAGMFTMTMAFGIGETMAAVMADASKGVTDRFRSMPMSPAAVVLGRSVSDLLYSMLGLATMIGCGLLVGWRARGSVGDTVLAFALLLFLRFAMLWIGIYLGLLVRNPEALAAVQTLLFPVTMVTNTFAAPGTMPGWLGTIADWNPLSATVSATRELFGNPGWSGDSWPATHATELAIAWPVVLTAVFAVLSIRRYQRLSR